MRGGKKENICAHLSNLLSLPLSSPLSSHGASVTKERDPVIKTHYYKIFALHFVLIHLVELVSFEEVVR